MERPASHKASTAIPGGSPRYPAIWQRQRPSRACTGRGGLMRASASPFTGGGRVRTTSTCSSSARTSIFTGSPSPAGNVSRRNSVFSGSSPRSRPRSINTACEIGRISQPVSAGHTNRCRGVNPRRSASATPASSCRMSRRAGGPSCATSTPTPSRRAVCVMAVIKPGRSFMSQCATCKRGALRSGTAALAKRSTSTTSLPPKSTTTKSVGCGSMAAC